MSERRLRSPVTRTQWRFFAMTGIGLIVALAGAACSGAGGTGGGGGSKTMTLAGVDNPQMADLKTLVSNFQSKQCDITVRIVTLPDDQARPQVPADGGAHHGGY